MVDKSGATGPVPPLNQFTDIVWFQWLDATADAGVDKKSVRYFYRYHIADTNSKAVIEEVLAMDGVCGCRTLFSWACKANTFTAKSPQIPRAHIYHDKR